MFKGLNRFKNNIIIGGNNISMSNSGGKTKVTVDGKVFIINSTNVSIINGQIYADGKLYINDNTVFKKDTVIQNVTIEGNVETVDCGGSVVVTGNVNKDIDCGGSATIKGSVTGNIDAGGSVSVQGDHKGSIDAGGSVRIG